ncbi:hypothetical protein [Pseudomonas atacamensis]|uniref:hypothetical protein n=1 Tax=Pseudomonas atacamensis TaxID=2565368 RepID=UPI001FADA24C|nr:hypothetical protein [Pseudomonas atacamensis]MCI9874475.1 hypothetical protein [Pseudomonas atacamensis]
MYFGPADVTFLHNYIRLPTNQHDVYAHPGIEINLTDFRPRVAQLEFPAGLEGVEEATHVRVRVPNGMEYEGEITPRAAGRGVTSILFKIQRAVDTSSESDE